MLLRDLFQRNPNIIINTDIDGFLSGMILQKYYNCRVVGFSNSRETIWVIPELESIYDAVYIDLYVNRPDVVCIDQHIISYNKQHHEKIEAMGTKINPNLERRRTFVGDYDGDYYHKYPFGTVHYLMSLMAKEGINVDFGRLGVDYRFKINGKNYITSAGHVMLRADDALYSTLSPYRANALDWWKWLDPENKSSAINAIRRFLDTCDINKAEKYKKDIGDFFKALGCDGIDGAFKTVTDKDGNLLPKVREYNEIICGLMGMKLSLPPKYIIHKGQYLLSFCRPGNDMEILESGDLYSYAFIYGPRSMYKNFSYTVDMED